MFCPSNLIRSHKLLGHVQTTQDGYQTHSPPSPSPRRLSLSAPLPDSTISSVGFQLHVHAEATMTEL